MAYEITRVDVWAGEVEDRPGALAAKLEALERAGANLEFVVVRPLTEAHGVGVLFAAPLIGTDQVRAAEEVGVRKAASMYVLRVIGPDRPGLVAGITRTVADAGINISGLTASALGDRAVAYLRFESDADARRAAQILTPRLA